MRLLRLWIILVGAPLVWLAYLQIAYMLSTWTCAPVRAVTLAIVLLISAVAVGAICWTGWDSWQGKSAPVAAPGDVSAERSRFMVASGLAQKCLIALLVLASAIPIGFLQACQ
jgi:hypothetical protein